MNKKGYNFMAFTIIVLFFIFVAVFAGIFVALKKRSLQENMDNQINYHQAETDLLVFLRLPVEVKGYTMTVAELIINLAEEQMTIGGKKYSFEGISVKKTSSNNKYLQPLITSTKDFFHATYIQHKPETWSLKIYFPHKDRNLKHEFIIFQSENLFKNTYDTVTTTFAVTNYRNSVRTNLPLISEQSVEVRLYPSVETKDK